MRLIDADELKELYFNTPKYSVPCKVILANIDDMPTVYDIAKIIKKIEERIDYWKSEAAVYDEFGDIQGMDMCDFKVDELQRVISIIKEKE